MSEVTIIGMDIIKHVFHAHGAMSRADHYSASGSVEESCWISSRPYQVILSRSTR